MRPNVKTYLLDFTDSYLATAQWVTCDSGEGARGFTKLAIKEARIDCEAFIVKVIAEFTPDEAHKILSYAGNDVKRISGHDFYLTRNHHGAGFWDSAIYNELANNGCERLTKLSESCGEASAYIGRGYIHFD
jgi:hypothetical protein